MPDLVMDLPNAKTTLGGPPKEATTPGILPAAKPEDVPRETKDGLEIAKDNLPKPPPAPPVKPQEKDASRFAALAKKEKGLVLKANDLKMKEGKFAERESALMAREAKVSEFEALRNADNPLKALEFLGYSYKDLTDYILKGEKPTPELIAKSFDRKMSDWEKRLEEREKNAESARQKQADEAKRQAEDEAKQAYEGWQTEVADWCKGQVDALELINLNEAYHLVTATIEEQFQRTKKVLSTADAAKMVEDFLESEVKRNLEAKKLKAKVEAKVPEPTKPVEKPDSKEASPRTITNTMTSSAPSFLPAKTEQDRINRALAALSKAS